MRIAAYLAQAMFFLDGLASRGQPIQEGHCLGQVTRSARYICTMAYGKSLRGCKARLPTSQCCYHRSGLQHLRWVLSGTSASGGTGGKLQHVPAHPSICICFTIKHYLVSVAMATVQRVCSRGVSHGMLECWEDCHCCLPSCMPRLIVPTWHICHKLSKLSTGMVGMLSRH